MKIGIVGASGRMGRMNIAEVLKDEKTTLASALEAEGSKFIGHDAARLESESTGEVKITDNIPEFLSKSEAIIDFSRPEATLNLARHASELGVIHIIGTTGLSAEQEKQLEEYAAKIPIVYAPNMSVGVNLLFALTRKVASVLDEDYDIEVVEMHHRHKVDSPSGTALGIGKAAADGRNVNLEDVWCKSRDGITGERQKGEIGFATLRGGDVVGDHTAVFAAEGERIELTHKASDRSIFSKGAVRAALWAKDKNPALYSMADVLGIDF